MESEKRQNRTLKETPPRRFRCSECKYTSTRLYNITRHEFRIHSASTKPRICCGKLFATKSEYYLHCEENHPNTRLNNIMSRKKYKIFPKSMIPKSLVKTEPETWLPEVLREIPYMLRSHVRRNIFARDPKIELVTDLSLKVEKSVDESQLEVVSRENSVIFSESSGYETKLSENSTLDPEEVNLENKHSSFEERDTTKTPQLPCLDGTRETVIEESSMPNLTKFFENDVTTAGFSGNSTSGAQESREESNAILIEQKTDVKHKNADETSHILHTTECFEKNVKKESVAVKSEDIKLFNSDIKKEKCSGAWSTLNPYYLPPKKRILLTLGLLNRENISNPVKPIADRLRPRKPLQETPLRKKRLSKKMKRRSLRKGITSPRHPSASSDQENISPLTANDRKEIIVGLSVDLRANGRSTWEEITVQMRERLQLIDFDSFKSLK